MKAAGQTWHILLIVRIMLMATKIHSAIYTKTFESYIGVYNNNLTYNWSSALSYCESQYGTSLASIHSSMDEISIGSARYTTNSSTWIGLADIQEEGFWVWSDGTDYDYNISWKTNDSYFNLNLSLYQDCAKILSSNSYMGCNSTSMHCIKFSDELCSYLSNQFICNNVKSDPPTILISLYNAWGLGSICFIVCLQSCCIGLMCTDQRHQIRPSLEFVFISYYTKEQELFDNNQNTYTNTGNDEIRLGVSRRSIVRCTANGNTAAGEDLDAYVDQLVMSTTDPSYAYTNDLERIRQNGQLNVEIDSLFAKSKYIDDKNARIVSGNWYLGETVGKGAFGWVKKGLEVDTGDIVALKFIPPSINLTEQKFEQQIDSEIEVLSKISHPHIVSLLSYVLDCPYPANTDTNGIQLIDTTLFVFEFARKGQLFDVLHHTKQLPENICAT